tara:strand:- start:562 stop:1797 length:1236 start_codon:yes stop_codon:yes gene_type:complete
MKYSLADAHKTEISLIPIILSMEQTGIRLHPHIKDIANTWDGKLQEGDDAIRKVIGPDCTIGGKLMFNKLRSLNLIDESKITYTDKGNPRYGREFIDELVIDEDLAKILKVRSKLTKLLGTYLRPWAEAFEAHGKFHPYFNSVRNLDDRGTRTGRFSSNMQQIPKEADPNLVNLRTLIYPDEEDHVILVRDFSAQEIRVAAHYAEGAILKAYNDDPSIDVHEFIQNLIRENTGIDLPRRISKTITFLKMYGGGAQKLSDMLNVDINDARSFYAAYDAALPEFKQLGKDIEEMVKSGTKLRTWGGRLYDVEPAEYYNGALWEKYYKLSNTLIQGSSADMTKHAMIRYVSHKDRKGRLILQVHDELVVSVKEQHRDSEMEILRWAMNEIPGWDMPIRSSGEYGPNYGDLTKWD